MSKKLSCEQIEALIGFYADGTLHTLLRRSVKEHLENCPECMAKFLEIKTILNEQVETKSNDILPESRQYELFKHNLSAYIDNELNDDENIKIKKFAISNPLARKDLENLLNFKKLLHSSFEKTKNDFKNDYSKNISSKIQHELNIDMVDPFYKIAAILLGMLGFLIITFLSVLHL